MLINVTSFKFSSYYLLASSAASGPLARIFIKTIVLIEMHRKLYQKKKVLCCVVGVKPIVRLWDLSL